MRNLFKRITPVILALALVFSLGAFSGCKTPGPDQSDETVYTIIVKYEDGTAVDGTNGWDGYETVAIKVQFCQVDANHVVGTCYNPVALGSNGMVTLNPADLAGIDYQGEYKIALNNLPDGYTVDNVYVSSTPQTVTITVKAVA